MDSKPAEPNLRLTIEKSNEVFVYKLVDPSTGAVVLEIPQQEVAQMGGRPSYAAGAVISTKV